MTSKTKDKLKKLTKALEKIVRDQITKQDHVDTGAMRASIDAEIKFTSKGFELEIVGLEYFAYVSGNYAIMKNVFASKRYKDLEKEIEQIFFEEIEDTIEKSFNKK